MSGLQPEASPPSGVYGLKLHRETPMSLPAIRDLALTSEFALPPTRIVGREVECVRASAHVETTIANMHPGYST